MHGWGVVRGLSHSSQMSRSRLPLMQSYASVTTGSSPLPYIPPLSTPASRSLPLQILLALFMTLVVLSSVLQFAGLHHGLRYVDDGSPIATASPTQLMAAEDTLELALDSDVFEVILEQLDAMNREIDDDASASFSIAYHGRTVHNGDIVPMSEAATAPSIAIEDGGALFTWLLIDIDAPDPQDPSHAPFLHYIVADLDTSTSGSVDAKQQNVVVPYYPVTPPKGEHCYVSLLFRQRAPHASLTAEQNVERRNFDVVAFARDHRLVLASTSHFYSQAAVGEKEQEDD